MKFFRDERAGALVMLVAAVLGFGLFNLTGSPAGWSEIHVTAWPWVSQLGMTFFFALIGIEMRLEFDGGVFKNKRNVLVPAFAAVSGVALPALTYLGLAVATNQLGLAKGWPIVTATDVSFALMVFSLAGSHLGRPMRSFLLSFAVIDDLIACFALALAFGRFEALTPLISTSVAVAISFLVPTSLSKRVMNFLSPFVAFVVLPVFAFFAMQIGFESGALFGPIAGGLALLIATRPIAKWLGVYLGARFATRLLADAERGIHSKMGHFKVASLAGIGFTVSLLAASFAFGVSSKLYSAAASLTVVASIISALAAVIVLKARRGAK